MTVRELARETFECLRPPRFTTVSQWADENRVLVSESSSEVGRWRTDRAPYQREIMDAFTQPGVWKIVIKASAQVGKTELELNMMGRAIDLDPGPMLFIQPTDGFAEDFSKRRVAPMIKACGALSRKVYEAKSRDAGNTITMKTFPGGSVTFTGANSPTELAGRPVRYEFMDEIDRFPPSAGTEGDPLELAERRTETYRYNRKIVQTSTPTVKGASKIERAYLEGTQEQWHVECPGCGAYSYIVFPDIRWTTATDAKRAGDIETIVWRCPKCGHETGEHETKRLPAKWVRHNEGALGDGVRSFALNAFTSPWSDWKTIVRDFLRSKDDPELLKVFYNTVLGETFEFMDHSGEPEKLYSRREAYEREVPEGVLLLTCGIDTQDNRLEYEVVGWDRHEQSWGILNGAIPGRPDSDEVWSEVDDLLAREFKMGAGRAMRISATFIDSGGHFTQDVYRQCTRRMNKRIWPIKGEGGSGKQYVRPMTKGAGSEAMRFVIGVDAGKEAVLHSSTVAKPGPRYMHYPSNYGRYDMDYFRGLLSEKMVMHRRAGQTYVAWEKTYERNEPLDIRNYARAAYKYFNWNFDKYEALVNGEEARTEVRTKEARKPRRVISAGITV